MKNNMFEYGFVANLVVSYNTLSALKGRTCRVLKFEELTICGYPLTHFMPLLREGYTLNYHHSTPKTIYVVAYNEPKSLFDSLRRKGYSVRRVAGMIDLYKISRNGVRINESNDLTSILYNKEKGKTVKIEKASLPSQSEKETQEAEITPEIERNITFDAQNADFSQKTQISNSENEKGEDIPSRSTNNTKLTAASDQLREKIENITNY